MLLRGESRSPFSQAECLRPICGLLVTQSRASPFRHSETHGMPSAKHQAVGRYGVKNEEQREKHPNELDAGDPKLLIHSHCSAQPGSAQATWCCHTSHPIVTAAIWAA